MVLLRLLQRKRKTTGSSTWERTPPSPLGTDGRRRLQEQPYALPKDHQEEERLKFQHRMLYAHLRRHSFAPLQPASVRHILDVGCGPGVWLSDLATLFPTASLIGLDSDALQVELAAQLKHPRCQFVQGDVLRGLPFETGTFEYTHMRCMVLAIPAPFWPFVIGELVRVTAPGGWIELFDGGQGCERVGPYMQQMLIWGQLVLEQKGFDLRLIEQLGEMLRQAGVGNVSEQHFTLPLGTWAGRVGALMGKDLLAIFEAFKAPLCSALSLPPEQVDAVLQELPQEWNAYHTSYTYIETHGQHGEVSHE